MISPADGFADAIRRRKEIVMSAIQPSDNAEATRLAIAYAIALRYDANSSDEMANNIRRLVTLMTYGDEKTPQARIVPQR